MGPVIERFDHLEIGVHLHSRPDEAANKILAAYDAGCRRFDSAIGGLGGCPFAQDVLVGNIPTETVLESLRLRDASLPPTKPLTELIARSAKLAEQFGGPKM